MMHASCSLKGLKFKPKEARADAEADLYDAMVKTAVVWFRKATQPTMNPDDGFPVVTGMAKASFTRLHEFLKDEGKRVAFSIDGVQYEKVIPGVKSRTQGVAQSKKDNFIVVMRNQYGPFKLIFDWWTDVKHFIVNETSLTAKEEFNLAHDTPWNIIEEANTAAQAYLPTALKQIRLLKDKHLVPYTRTIT
jgi:hypothetical protein